MTLEKFKKWCQSIYEEYINDENTEKAYENSEKVILIDVKNEKLYSHSIKNTSIKDPFVNLALAYAEMKNYEIPEIADNSASARVDKGEHYYCIYQSTDGDPFYPVEYIEYNKNIDSKRYNSNNYFRTSEQAERVIDKINLLLRLEQLRTLYCPDYEPDWSDAKDKFCVFYNHNSHKFDYLRVINDESKTDIYFPDPIVAQKVCDELNKELME